MDSKMMTKRIFITISVIMLLILFLFQFTGVVRRKYNDYESNSYVTATATTLTKSDEYTVKTNAGEVLLAGNNYIVYIGNIDDSYGKTVYQWCRFTKRNLINYTDIERYDMSEWNKPEMVIIDSNYVDYTTQLEDVKAISDAGVNVTLCTLPSYDDTRRNKELMDYCGIDNVARKVTATGVRIFDDFLLGGEIWFTVDNDQEGTYSDMTPTVPWFITTTGTKTYMAAELDAKSYEGLENENQPSLVWRKRLDNAYVFCINGDFISDIFGTGILNAIAYEAKDYDIYPVVDAQTFIVSDFPYLSNENESLIQKYYSRTTSSFLENVLWPDISNLSSKLNLKMTFMAAPQLDYSDRVHVSINELDYFFRLVRELNSEVGLTTTRSENDTVEDKLNADKNAYSSYLGSYEFLSIKAKKSELTAIQKLKNSMMDSVKTYVTGSDEFDGTGLFSYADDGKLIIETPTDSSTYTFSRDFRARCLNTAVAYSGIDMDVSNLYYPDSEENLWNKYIKSVSSCTQNITKQTGKLTQCTVSELDKRVREMLSLDFTYRMDGETLVVDIKGNQETSRFILRTHNKEILSVNGGTYTLLEDGAYLITTTEKQLRIVF